MKDGLSCVLFRAIVVWEITQLSPSLSRKPLNFRTLIRTLEIPSQILETIGTDDPHYLYVYGTFLVEYSAYWLTASLYFVLDFTQWPKFLQKYKTQPGTNEPPNTKKFLKVGMPSHINQSLLCKQFRIIWQRIQLAN